MFPIPREVLDACWPDAEWLGMDCEEPPCIAAVRIDSVEGYSKPILNCPQWQQAYGFPDISATEYECPDGSSGYISTLLPAMSHLVDDPFDTTTDESCMTREVREDGTVIMHLVQTAECDSRQTPRNARRKRTAYTWGPDGASGFAYGKACGFY